MNQDVSKQKEEIAVQDYVADFYEEERYKNPDSLAYHVWWAKKMLSFLNLKSPILDNGCGNGFMAEFLKGYEVVGLDVSPRMVELARKRYSKVILGDSQNLPFDDSSFAIAINRSILHHLQDPEKGVSEVRRVLKSGGQAIFAETLLSPLSAIPRILLKRGKHFSSSHRNFKEEELKGIVTRHFKIKKVYYFGYLAYSLLGFPDVVNIYKFIPFKKIITPALIKFDELISKIPLLNRICWCVMIVAEK